MQERAQRFELINLDTLPKEGTAVAWLGGAGMLIARGDARILIDPCLHVEADGMTEAGHKAFYPMPLKPEEIPAGTVVLYTHADGDHMGLPTAMRMKEGVRFYAPAPCICALEEAGIAKARLHLIKPGDMFEIEEMEIRAIAADHSWQETNPELFGEPYGPEGCVGFDIAAPDGRMLFPGDTRLCAHHMELKDEYDLLALDVSDDPYHLGHENMVKLARHLAKARLLPNHFGTYDAPEAVPHNGSLLKLKSLLSEDAVRVLPDVIGRVFQIDAMED